MKNSQMVNRPHDSMAGDGIVASGVRRVSKGGYIRYAKQRWQHDALKEYEGSDVWVTTGDYWMTEVIIGFPNMADYICTAKSAL